MDFPISVPSIGLVDGKFADEDPLGGTPGSLIPAQWGNGVTLEILNVIEAGGLEPNEVDNAQLILAIRNIIQVAQIRVLVDTGIAGAYAAVNPKPLTALPATGYIQRVQIANSNTGAATYSPDGLAARPIYGLGLQPLQGGELPIGVAVLMYLVQAGVNGGNGAWIIIESLGGAAQVAPATKSQHAIQLNQMAAVAGGTLNAKMSVAVASATATLTADEVAVKSALGGVPWLLSTFNKTVNLAIVGAGGMDTGTAPVSGYVALYAIYNPSTATSAMLAVNATASIAPNVYGGTNMPAGYTASALVSVWPTNASSQFAAGFMLGRKVGTIGSNAITTSTTPGAFTSLSIASSVPPNAKTVTVNINGSCTAINSTMFIAMASDTTGLGTIAVGFSTTVAGQGTSSYGEVGLLTPQTVYWRATNTAGTPTYNISIGSYTF
jgi:hypothetical protein